VWHGCHTFPILALHFKAVLKTGSGRRVWETKGFSCGFKIYFEDPHFDLSKDTVSDINRIIEN